ncbi:MAG: cob(I)yrinic acid a,c-diamide adenosyltransferase [Candidatus Omnitrophota bacterium]|nr:cob(I)yrinic acid a,c-diamide adenosyltransferase [Candidatus Omnitrophota bacterium]
MKTKPRRLELVLTGRGAIKDAIKNADLVSKIEKIKHPYDSGVPGRIGIEY